jgi:hypothetical protein
MPGHIEGDDAMAADDARVIHQRAILPPVAARGVQAQKRGALAGLFDIDAMGSAEQIKMHVAADDRFELHAHSEPPSGRSLASASLK